LDLTGAASIFSVEAQNKQSFNKSSLLVVPFSLVAEYRGRIILRNVDELPDYTVSNAAEPNHTLLVVIETKNFHHYYKEFYLNPGSI
jgi:hypothetical protein